MVNREFNNVNINVEFTETSNRQQLSSNDNIKTLFGKIKKWLSDLKPVAFSGDFNDLLNKPEAADFLDEKGFGNLRYHDKQLQYYDADQGIWLDTNTVLDCGNWMDSNKALNDKPD